MKNRFLKGLEKKQKYKKSSAGEFSDENLSSEDEMEVQQSKLGKIISNRYIILSYISRGTFSRIWLVWDSLDDSFKAAKFFSDDCFEEANNEIKLHNEIGNYAYVSKLFESITLKDNIILIYELLGVSLFEILRDLDENIYEIENDIVNKIMKEILLGLQHIHSKKLVHLDMKPENILTTILTDRIKYIIFKFKQQNPKKTFDDSYSKGIGELTEKLEASNIYKKKMIRRRIRNKSLKELQIPILDDFNNDYDINLIKAGDFKVKLIDLGNSDYESNLENDFQPQYLACYRPPFERYYTCKSDIWALGCIYYELLTNGDYLCEDNYATLFKYFGDSIETNNCDVYSLTEQIGKKNYLGQFLIYNQHLRLDCNHLLKLFSN